MLAILLSWIIISFVLFSFGDILLSLYQIVCKQNEHYNIIDTFLIGMCFVVGVLSISSIWLPSNHYILFIYVVVSTIYWVLCKGRFFSIVQKIKALMSQLSMLNLVLLSILLLSILFYMCWAAHWFDATYYHYQNIRWNEEYAVVPGLGNLEHRLGFNSNYMLLSAIFSLRFLCGEAIYGGLQSFLTVLIVCWIVVELIRSNFELKRIFLLFFYLLLFAYNVDGMTDSSTDFIPSYCVFYLVARFILYPDLFKDSKLLYFLLPVTLITFKLSVAPICVIGIVILIYILRKRDIKTLSFFIVLALIVTIPWVVRNVIVTGYLFFPLSAIDIFTFDWKIPESIAIAESANVSGNARLAFIDFITLRYFTSFGFMNNKLLFITALVMNITCLLVVVSPLIIGYRYRQGKRMSNNFMMIYLVLVLYLIYWYLLAPDPRFASGAFLAFDFLLVSMLISDKVKTYPLLGKFLLIILTATLLLSSFKRTFNFYKLLYPTSLKEGREPLHSVFYRPYSSKNQSEARRVPQGEFTTYKLGVLDIYITPDWNRGACYDKLPATSLNPLRLQLKYQPLTTIEARGTTLQEGFRPKEEFRN